MRLLTPDKAIAGLEDFVITPNRSTDYPPSLGVIIHKKANFDERSYLKSIQVQGTALGVSIHVLECGDYVEASQAITTLLKLSFIHGIIILSSFGNEDINQVLANKIPSRLDIDCMSYFTLGHMIKSPDKVAYRLGPCAPVAAIKLLEYDQEQATLLDLTGKRVAILGRSARVGRPLTEMILQMNGTPTCYHSHSAWSIKELIDYDIIITGIGNPHIITGENFPAEWCGTIIDIGIAENDDGKICGDVDIESFAHTKAAITPVPNGVGKLATKVLFSKLFYNASQTQNGFL